jgi:hypothetical protein
MEEKLIEETFQHIKKSKYKFFNIEHVSEFVKEKVGDSYTSELGIAVKLGIKHHDKIEFFREGDYIHGSKFHYCSGNWLAIKGIYDNPVEAKFKMGWYTWQDTEEIDWDNLD